MYKNITTGTIGVGGHFCRLKKVTKEVEVLTSAFVIWLIILSIHWLHLSDSDSNIKEYYLKLNEICYSCIFKRTNDVLFLPCLIYLFY